MRLVFVLAVALLLACPGPTIDGSSPAAAEMSLEEIRRELSLEDRARLEEALRFIVARELGAAMRGGFGSPSSGEVDRKVAQLLDGKTAEEVIAHAQALRAERERGE